MYPSESLSLKLRGQWLRKKFRVTTSTFKQNKQTENGIEQTRRKKHYSALYLISQTRMSWNFHFHMSIYMCGYIIQGFPGGASGKEPACQCRRHKRRGFDPWVRKTPWRRKWQHTHVISSGKFHRQRSLAGFMGSQTVKHNWTPMHTHKGKTIPHFTVGVSPHCHSRILGSGQSLSIEGDN